MLQEVIFISRMA